MAEKKTIGEICNVLNGFAFKSDKYVSSGTRVIRITNVQKGYVVDDDPKYYPDAEMSHLRQYELHENDLLMSLTGNVGRVGLLTKKLLPAALNQRVACLRIKNNSVLQKYLFHYLNSDLFEQAAIFFASGIAQKNMSTEWLKKVEIPVPTIDEQQRIVDELDLLTGIIDKKNAQLRDLDALAQSIFHEMFGSNTSSWPSHRLGDICDTTSGGTPSKSHSEYYLNGTIPWLRSGEVEGTNITDTEIKITDLGVKYSSAKWFPAQTVVVAMYGATVGEVGILGKPMTTNQAVCGILPNGSLRPLYLYSWFRSKKMDFVEQATGGAQPNISQNIIRNSKICCPPLDIQDSFVERLVSIEEQKLLVEKSTRDTQSLLDGRMDLYFG